MTERLHVKDPKMKTTKGRNTLHLDSACNMLPRDKVNFFIKVVIFYLIDTYTVHDNTCQFIYF